MHRLATSSSWRFPWTEVATALQALTGPHRIHHYIRDGKPLSTTLGGQAEMIEAGRQTDESQEIYSFIYHCYEGIGETKITAPNGVETVVQWERSDTFAVPAWSKISHLNKNDEVPAYLFAINDRPLLENLHFLKNID